MELNVNPDIIKIHVKETLHYQHSLRRIIIITFINWQWFEIKYLVFGYNSDFKVCINIVFYRLVEFPFNNVEFRPDGSSDSWCGVETRRCQNCSQASGDIDDHWAWCGTRTMHMRLATRLQRLASIIDDTGIRFLCFFSCHQLSLTDLRICTVKLMVVPRKNPYLVDLYVLFAAVVVEKALSMNLSDGASALYQEGRYGKLQHVLISV